MENKSVAYIISTRRKALGLTQQALADRLHISNKAISKWETGEGLPDISILKDLASVLEISVDELLTGSQIVNESPLEKKKIKSIRIFTLTTRFFLILDFFLPFISVPLSSVLPDWIGLDQTFDTIFGNSLQASVSGFQLSLNINLLGILLMVTLIIQACLLILDLLHQLDHEPSPLWLKSIHLLTILMALLFIGFSLISKIQIQIGSILFMVFTLSLGLQGLKLSHKK